jgi:uncharacterized protein
VRLEGTLQIAASRAEVWTVLLEPIRLCQVIPGCESLQRTDATHFAATLAVKVQFMTLRASATCTLVEVDPPHRLVAEITGETTVLAGAFRNVITIVLSEADGGTHLDYEMELSLLGRLASLGQPIVRAASQQVVKQFEENLRRLLEPPEIIAR